MCFFHFLLQLSQQNPRIYVRIVRVFTRLKPVVFFNMKLLELVQQAVAIANIRGEYNLDRHIAVLRGFLLMEATVCNVKLTVFSVQIAQQEAVIDVKKAFC